MIRSVYTTDTQEDAEPKQEILIFLLYIYLTRVHKELSEHILFMVHLKCNHKVQETILRTLLHEMFRGKLCPET